MATPLLTATPGAAPTYNPGMAETFSWIPIEGVERPLFAQAVYLVGSDASAGITSEQASTIISLLSTIAQNTAS
jgi:hypothetical protein